MFGPVATLHEARHAECVRLCLDSDGSLGEPIATGRTFKVLTAKHPSGLTLVISVDVQSVPGGPWHRLSGPDLPKLGEGDETDGEPAPRMSVCELMGLHVDLLKIDRLRSTGKATDRIRADALMADVVARAARPARHA